MPVPLSIWPTPQWNRNLQIIQATHSQDYIGRSFHGNSYVIADMKALTAKDNRPTDPDPHPPYVKLSAMDLGSDVMDLGSDSSVTAMRLRRYGPGQYQSE